METVAVTIIPTHTSSLVVHGLGSLPLYAVTLRDAFSFHNDLLSTLRGDQSILMAAPSLPFGGGCGPVHALRLASPRVRKLSEVINSLVIEPYHTRHVEGIRNLAQHVCSENLVGIHQGNHDHARDRKALSAGGFLLVLATYLKFSSSIFLHL